MLISNKMEKLLIFHRIIAPYRIDFFNALADKYDIRVCLFQDNLNGQKFNYKTIEDQLNFRPIYLLEKTLGFKHGVLQNIKQFKPDVIIVSECSTEAVLSIFYRKITGAKYRIVSIIDDSYDMLVGNNQFSRLHEIAEKIVLPKIDGIITVEPRVADYFKKAYGKSIYFPIIVDEKKARERYQHILPISEQFVDKYNLVGKKLLLFVGRLVEIKNLQMVIPTFRSLEDEDYRLIVVGAGDYESELKELAYNDDRIIFVGRKEGDELYAWYNIAQIFVLPSYQEPFGAVTNEALLGGCWSLISEKAGSQCLIENGVNGYTFSPYNIKDFSDKLKNSLNMLEPIEYPLKQRPNLMRLDFALKMKEVLDLLILPNDKTSYNQFSENDIKK